MIKALFTAFSSNWRYFLYVAVICLVAVFFRLPLGVGSVTAEQWRPAAFADAVSVSPSQELLLRRKAWLGSEGWVEDGATDAPEESEADIEDQYVLVGTAQEGRRKIAYLIINNDKFRSVDEGAELSSGDVVARVNSDQVEIQRANSTDIIKLRLYRYE